MKVTFLGTGAADWDIRTFRDGEFFRRNSSILINDDLLVDPNGHIFHFAEKNGTPDLFKNVKNIIVTHSHGDHFVPETVARLCVGTDCTVWADPACKRKLIRVLGEETAAKIRFVETKRNRDYEIGSYKVTSLRSNHATEDPDEDTRLYLIEQEGRILYYGCDSAWIPTVSWNVIRERPISAMVLELTCGETATYDWRIFEHNTPEMLDIMLTMFKKYNLFAPDVKYYVSHLARTLHTDHEGLVEYLKPRGVTPAYDGFSFEV